MKTIVYLLYGNRDKYQLELSYSVMSLVKQSKADAFDIKLICDEESARNDLPLQSVVVPDKQFADWTRNGEYWHEAKVHALKFACEQFGGNVCLVDTDTAFLRDAETLFQNIDRSSSVMHQFEKTIGDHDLWQTPLRQLPDMIGAYALRPETPMYNSGVVGVDATNAMLLDDVIDVLRYIDSRVKIFNTEQLAFSMVLGERTRLSCADNTVKHYWGFDRAFAHVQAKRYIGSDDGRLNGTTLPEDLPIIGMIGKSRWNVLRARLHLLSRRAAPRYRFAYIAYLTALALGRKDPELANIWAASALEIIREDRPPGNQVLSDFRKFTDDAKPDWMSDEVSRGWLTLHGRVPVPQPQ